MTHLLMSRIGNPEIAHRVFSPEEYIAWARTHYVRFSGGQPEDVKPSGLRLGAYVSDGRWVVQCPCGNGPSAHPEWRMACCPECGAIHHAVFPVDWRKAEAALLKREHPHNRHWFPRDEIARTHRLERAETVADLLRENENHSRMLSSSKGGQ